VSLTSNLLIQYPFHSGGDPVIPNDWFADLRTWIGPSVSETPVVTGPDITDLGASYSISFAISGSPLTLEGSVPKSSVGFTKVLLTLTGAGASVAVGSGWVVVNNVDDWVIGSYAATASEKTVKPLSISSTVYATQNRDVALASVTSEVITPGEDIAIPVLDPDTVLECLQVASDSEPPNPADSFQVKADLTAERIPLNEDDVVTYRYSQNPYGTATAVIQDVLVADTTGVITVIGTQLKLESGFNVDVTLDRNVLRIDAELGFGTGYNSAGTFLTPPTDQARWCIKEIAGAAPDVNGNISIVGGTGVTVEDSPGTHTVFIVADLR